MRGMQTIEIRKGYQTSFHGRWVIIGGGGYALFFFADPLLQTAGGVALGPTQGSKYVQPWIGTYMPLVSLGLFQPFPTLIASDPEDWVNVGPGKLTIVPVGV